MNKTILCVYAHAHAMMWEGGLTLPDLVYYLHHVGQGGTQASFILWATLLVLTEQL